MSNKIPSDKPSGGSPGVRRRDFLRDTTLMAGALLAMTFTGTRAAESAPAAGGAKAPKVRVGTCQFPVSSDLAANGEWIRKQMAEAQSLGADLVHFPETALSGYPGVDRGPLEDFPWTRQREELEKVLAAAKHLRVWVVLGAIHRLSGDHKPHNSLYVINPAGRIVDRYDKRFCTTGDLKHFSPGDHFVTFDVNGVRCGLLICYDVRFPELYRQYSKLGVQLMLHSLASSRRRCTQYSVDMNIYQRKQ